MKKIIIIGAGMGGLVAGNLLARKGYDVSIYESHSTPGGYTAGFWKKGFYFESGTLSFESSHMIFKTMRELGLSDKIEFIPQKSRWVSAEFDGIAGTYKEFKNIFQTAYAGNEGLQKYFAEVDKMYAAMMYFSQENKSRLRSIVDMVVGGVRMFMIYKKYAHQTVGKFTEKFFDKDTKLYRIFKNMGYPDMSAWLLGGAMASLFDDYWTVKGGMQSWADVLAENFMNCGGKLHLNAYVDKIVTKNGTAVGVVSNGESFSADYVISASDYKKTFLKLLDDPSLIPTQLRDKIQRAAVSEGFFTVYLGLDLPPEQMREYMKIPHVFYIDEQPGADIANPADENFFAKTSVFLYSPTVMNIRLAPPNKSSLMLQAIAPTNWMNNWGGGDKKKYRQLKEMVKNTMIAKASAVIPNLESLVEFSDAATPLTYERYTHNTAGATSAWSWNPEKKFHKQMMKSYIGTPVRNLYIGSCWASQIGGIPGAVAAAYQCVKKIG